MDLNKFCEGKIISWDGIKGYIDVFIIPPLSKPLFFNLNHYSSEIEPKKGDLVKFIRKGDRADHVILYLRSKENEREDI